MSQSRRSRWVAIAPIAAGSLLALACAATPESPGAVDLTGPAYDQFVGGGSNGSGVHVFLENQCGTLDCHGQVGRPLRLYSVNGLRAPNDAGLVSGSGAETTAELYANYLATIGVQPEVMDGVVAGTSPPTALLLLTKPMGLERHKGGTRIVLGDPMYRCLTSWLLAPSMQAPFDVGACDLAAALP